MTSPSAALATRSLRLLWMWCRVYTAFVPDEERLRRREEVCCHLWESECAGLAPRSVLWAAVRGSIDDLRWSAGKAGFRLARWLLTPMPYVVIAGVLTLQAWIFSLFVQQADRNTHISSLAGIGALMVAGLLWSIRRMRRR